MDIDQLRSELTKRGIPFAPNAGIANLQAKLDEALAKEQETPGVPTDETPTAPSGETPAATAPVPTGKPGKEKAAAPADGPSTAPAEPEDPDAGKRQRLINEKVAAGLPHDTAAEVADRQIAWDKEQEADSKKN